MSSSADPDTNVSDRRVWQESDFDEMLWKNVWIHGIGFIYEHPRRELIFDVDYILKWSKAVPSKTFHFWVAPSTLVFHDAGDIKLDWEGVFGGGPLQIYDLVREKKNSADGSKWSHWSLEDIHHRPHFIQCNWIRDVRQEEACLARWQSLVKRGRARRHKLRQNYRMINGNGKHLTLRNRQPTYWSAFGPEKFASGLILEGSL